MKRLLLFSVLMLMFCNTSCEEDNPSDLSKVAVPVTQSIADFRASVKVQEPRSIKQSGKIYAWKEFIFINDKNEGVHIIDNSDPFNPKNIKFLKIPRNMDIAISNDRLYADNGMDLVVFDISNMDEITEVGRVQDVFPNYYSTAPDGANYVDFENFDPSSEVIVGYIMETRKIEYATMEGWQRFESVNNSDGSTGTGGSMARFSLDGDYLYIADEASLSTFDISNPIEPTRIYNEYAGWQIETLFNYDGHLYLGSSTGMYIYNISEPAKPEKLSFLQHVRGCDPVVVKDNYAYVTIRGGNTCGQDFNQLDIVDISDKSQPQIVKTYEMNNPYGLGIKNDWLFVCDGNAGLKIYDTKETPNLKYIDQFSNINTYDVIPLDESLLMVGDNILYQYSYKGDEINLISSFSLN